MITLVAHYWGLSSLLLSGGPSRSSSSSGPAVSAINRICSFYWFTMTVSWMMMVILVSSSLVVQRSESFLIIPTTTTIISSRHHPPVIQQNHGHYSYFENVICSSNRYAVRRVGGRITALSSVQQQSTNEEEKQLTTKKKLRTWEESFELLRSYKENHGNCNVPRSYKDDPSLGLWVNNQRKRKKAISDDRIAKLDGLGFSWSNELYEKQWDEMFEKLREYNEMYGNCNVPQNYKDDRRLGIWVHNQRLNKDRLSDEKRAKLDGLSFSWSNELYEKQWDNMFQKLVLYSNENDGDCNIPNNEGDDENKDLIKWVEEQRKRKSLLSKERWTKLDKLGLIWEGAEKVKADQKWNEQYEILQEYKRKYGDCKVPIRWVENRSLGLWVDRQRQNYRKGLVREDREIKLEDIEFTWKVWERNAPDVSKLDFNWFIKFGKLLNFLEEHGHCDVPRYYKKDKSLAKWVQKQRETQKNGILRQDRKKYLDDIGVTWSFDDQKDKQWKEKYKALKTFKKQNGHLRLPETSKSLKTWVSLQRVQFAAGKMTQKKKAMLDEIGLKFNI